MAFWAAAIPAIASIAGGLAGAKDSRRSGNEARGYQSAGAGYLMDAGEVSDQFGDYAQQYAPAEKKLAGMLTAGVDPDYYSARAAGDVDTAFNQAEGRQQRGMERMGIDPSSMRFQQLTRNASYARSLAEAGARTGGREKARLANLNMLRQGVGLGREAMVNRASISQNVGGALMGQGNVQQGYAQQAAAGAGKGIGYGAAQAGEAISGLGGLFGKGGGGVGQDNIAMNYQPSSYISSIG